MSNTFIIYEPLLVFLSRLILLLAVQKFCFFLLVFIWTFSNHKSSYINTIIKLNINSNPPKIVRLLLFPPAWQMIFQCRSSHPKVFLEKSVLEMCSKFTGKHACRSVTLIKLQINFIEITLWHGCSPVNLLHILRTPFTKNTSGRLLLSV